MDNQNNNEFNNPITSGKNANNNNFKSIKPIKEKNSKMVLVLQKQLYYHFLVEL